jgi:uncharacterized protein YbjQ (UPF0145 family)
MIVTTTHSIEAHPVQHYLGIVTSECIVGANILKELVEGLRVGGGRSNTYEKVIEEARTIAINQLIQKAETIGANAIIGISLDFETVTTPGSMVMVMAIGTAVRI